MSARGVSIAVLAILVVVVVASGAAAAADPGTHEVQITNGSGDVNASYQYDASTGKITANYDSGPEEITLGNPDESALAIQWAVTNTTNTHDTVLVGPGTYNGSVAIATPGVTVEGVDGRGATTLANLGSDGVEIGFNVTATDVTVAGMNITGFDGGGSTDAGVYVNDGAARTVLERLSVPGGYVGIDVEKSDNVVVRDSELSSKLEIDNSLDVVVHNNTLNTYLSVSSFSDRAQITNNTIDVVGGTGIRVSHETDDTVIAGNSIANVSDGVVLKGNSENQTVRDNHIQNVGTGIRIAPDDLGSNTISNNIIHDTDGVGIEVRATLSRSSENTLTGNVVTDTSGTGIVVTSPSSTLVNNEINGTGGNGIYVEDADGILLEQNVANHSSLAGIYLNVTNESTVRGNEANGNDVGILLENSTRNDVIGNSASQSDSLGLFLYQSDSNVLEDNVARENQNGVVLEEATNTSISGTNASDNDVAGFYFISARNNTVSDAVSTDNGLGGFEVNFDSFDNEFDNVTATDNDQTAYASGNTVGGTNLVTGLDVGTDVTLDVETDNISINAFDGTAGTPNSDLDSLGGLVNVTNTSSPIDARLTFSYTDADANSLDESSVGLWNHTAGNWSEVMSASIDSGTNTVSVNLEASDTLGLYAESTSASGGSGGGGYYRPPPSDSGPEFTTTSIDLSSDAVAVGETITVAVDIDNDGDEHGDYTGTLTADGQTVDSGTVTVNSNWHETLTLSAGFDEAGTYQLAVDGQAAGSVEVTGESAFSVSDISMDPTTVEAGEPVTISATVTNDGAADGTMDIPLIVDGEEVGSESVTLGPGESATVTFEHTFDEPGPVTIGGVSAGSVEIQDGSADSGDSEESGEGDDGVSVLLILLGAIGIVVAGGAGAYFLYPKQVQTAVERLQVKVDELLETYRE